MTSKKKRSIIVYSIILIFLIWLIYWLTPSTPKGVELAPILEIQLNDETSRLDYLRNLVPEDAAFRREYNLSFINIRSPYDTSPFVFRRTQLHPFNSDSAALDEFEHYKDLFTDEFDSWRLFEEHLETNNNWFSSYKTTRFDRNHGIPMGIRTSPEILIGIQKHNVLITISYTGYSDYDNYIDEINEDIVYLSKLLKEFKDK